MSHLEVELIAKEGNFPYLEEKGRCGFGYGAVGMAEYWFYCG